MELKVGKSLWDEIESAARAKHGVGSEFVLTMVDLGHPNTRTIGNCAYRINNFKDKTHYEGRVDFNPYK